MEQSLRSVKNATQLKGTSKKGSRDRVIRGKVTKAKTPGPTKGRAPRLAPPIRRYLSQWELVEQESVKAARASSLRAKRSSTVVENEAMEDVIYMGSRSLNTAREMGSIGDQDAGKTRPSPKKTRSGRTIKLTKKSSEGLGR